MPVNRRQRSIDEDSERIPAYASLLSGTVVKKYTDMTQVDATIPCEFVEQTRVSKTYTANEQQKRMNIREIEIVYNFIGAFNFEEAQEQSQTAQDKNNAKIDAA